METRVLVLKQGYLKKLPNQTRIGSSLKRADRRWVTFGLTREQQPYLAFYTNEDSVTTTAPLKAIPLRTCCHITKSLNLKGHTNVFTMTLADRQLSLMAPTLDQMDDWCRILDTTLKSLGILKPDENLYTVRLSPQLRRDPSPSYEYRRLSAPLPPPPSSASSNSLGSRDPSSPLPLAPRSGRLPALPPGTHPEPTSCLPSAAAPSVYAPDLSYLHENEMNQRQAEVAAASGEVYEAVWDRASGPASGGGVQATTPAPNASSAAASGASSPPILGTLGPPPPIPHRSSRVSVNMDTAGSARARPTSATQSPHVAATRSPASHNTPTRQAPPPPLPAETDYGVIWTESSSRAGPAGRGAGGREESAQDGIAPPRYSERDEGQEVTFLGTSRPNNFLAANALTTPSMTSPGSSHGVSLVRPAGPAATPSPISPQVVHTTSPPYTPSPGGATGYSFSPAPLGHQGTPSSPLGVLPSKMMEALGINGDNNTSNQHLQNPSNPDPQVYGWNAPPLDDHDAPPPYMPRNIANRGPQKSLKETQVEALQKEMSHAGGVKVTLRKTDCHLTIAWVDICGSTWIAGWNQKARPFLHNAFHVGDQVVSVNGQVVENARMAHKLIKHSDDQAKITFILKRVPHARVFALKRNEDGEDLGFRREGGTAEIIDVVPFGVAARYGVAARAPTSDGRNLCNWFITEINMRPINLFFKEDEIEKRLNAVGKDISILIQPMEFTDELKTQLKKNLKNYKDFVVQ